MGDLRDRIESLGVAADRILENEPMARHTSFRIGGAADCFVTVVNEVELSAVLYYLSDNDIDHLLIGNGTNLLFPDDGYRGVIIRLGGDMERIKASGNTIVAGGAAILSAVSRTALEHGLAGMEFAAGIPGTVGGALYMNAGAYDGEISQIMYSATVMSVDGEERVRVMNKDMDFSYRYSNLQESGYIVMKAAFELPSGDPAEIEARMKDLAARRSSKQPLDLPSAGSTFKRPEGGYAAAMIEEAGLKGEVVGGAAVSDKHAGFIVNKGGGTATDVVELMNIVRRRVYESTGTVLEPEVRLVGCELETI